MAICMAFFLIIFFIFPQPKGAQRRHVLMLLARTTQYILILDSALSQSIWKQMVNAPHTARGAVKEGEIEHPR